MSYQITVEPSGRQFTAEEDQTILAAGISHSIPLPYGCQDGACGSCKCLKISGEVEMGTHSDRALSEAEKAAGFILACRSKAKSDVVLENKQVTDSNAFPVKKLPVRVFAIEDKAPDVKRMVLQLPAGAPLQFHAGQFVEFILQDGSRRSYSMGNAPHTVAIAATEESPAANRIELHIRHLPGGKFTDPLFNGTIKEKAILRAEGPLGGFYLREGDKPIVLLASGTGFAPIKALIEHLQFEDSKRPIHFYWGGRRPQDLYMHDWVLAKAAEMPTLQYIPVISDALAEDNWGGRTGFVHAAVVQDIADLSGYEVYACGAPIVINSAVKLYTEQHGLPAEAFFSDSFTSEADK